MNKKDLVVSVLASFCLTATLFMIVPIRSQPVEEYDPWVDTNDDGMIDIKDILHLALKYGATGTPINKTELLLKLEARLEILNATVIALGQQISSLEVETEKHAHIFAGYVDGTPFEVSLPAEWSSFENVEVTATGYKYNTMDASKQGPLIIVSTVNTSNDKITFEVWDMNGNEYGESGWAGHEAHIDFVSLATK